ncbi:MAG: DUF1203 domain-containing protein [Acidobacteriia bacterium]|nr:DUF1203 domain-containing protein [Terriglobia bacterium]
MTSDFQIVALSRENFVHLFSMNDAELAAQGARRLRVDEDPGYPCRVSLMDAPIGEGVILTPFKHHNVDSPYQSAGPVFVRETAQTARPEVNEIPLMFHHRLLSARAYDNTAMMRGAKVVEGRSLEEAIRHFFSDRDVAYLHLHNAGAGCFNCLVKRP